MSESMSRVAIALGFLSQFAGLPKKVQKKTSEFVTLFQSNPRASGINYEHITGVRDKNLRSVRIGDDYRGIVCAPETGNVYMLLWVDHHDEAYEWARKRVCRVNPETGALQVVVETGDLAAAQPVQQEKHPTLFGNIRDKDLLRFGIPAENIPAVRAVQSEDELDALGPAIPEEAMDPLYMLAAGYSIEDVHREIEISAAPQVDVSDFSAALSLTESLRRFVVVESELELQKILEAPLEQWRVFLHPTQRRVVERDWNGPVRVLGGAGTGKTVVAMHRARWLARYRYIKPDDRILFTTFTRNLAQDIHVNLEKLCPECLERIEVINIDSWVARFLKQKEVSARVCYEQEWEPLWDQAVSELDSRLGLPAAFYRDEWEQIIQPQSVTTDAQYFLATRVGRGTRLNREKRAHVWKVFARYRQLMEDARLVEPDDAMRLATRLIKERKVVFPYRAVIVDEAQDMGTQAFMLLRAIAGEQHDNDMFIVGDAHQRIYRRSVVLGRCDIRITGRSRKLRINYRTTEQIRRQAVALLSGMSVDDLDGGTDNNRGFKSLLHGEAPMQKGFETFDRQMVFVADCLGKWRELGIPPEAICVIARSNNYLSQIGAVLSEKGIAHSVVKPDKPEGSQKGVRLATMHRVKGLEFDAVIVAGLSADQFPVVPQGDFDAASLRTFEDRERCLLYVSLTRAKKAAVLCWHGERSGVLEHLSAKRSV